MDGFRFSVFAISMDGSTVHFPARAPQKFRAYLLWLTRESRGGSLALGRDGRGGLGEGFSRFLNYLIGASICGHIYTG